MRVLFLSHSKQQCGVYQYGVNICNALSKSDSIDFIYAECTNIFSFINIIDINKPDIICLNYYPGGAMVWPDSHFHIAKKIIGTRKIPMVATFHESTPGKILGGDHSQFDYVLCLDPSLKSPLPEKYIAIPRLIITDNKEYKKPEKLTIASFGFPGVHKGFIELLTLVNNEFTDKEVHLKLHLPSNNSDPRTSDENYVLKSLLEFKRRPNISLAISRDFLHTSQILEFLGASHLNCFMYHSLPNRGISSCIDHALGVKVPIAVSNSNMFRHILHKKDLICVEQNTLTSIMERGTAPLEEFYTKWSEQQFVLDMTQIFTNIYNHYRNV